MSRIILSLVILIFCMACNDSSEGIQQAAATKMSEQTKSLPVTGSNKPKNIDGSRITNADREPGDWLTHGRTYDEQRFSPLTGINDQNVKKLGLAWFRDFNARRGLEATPLVLNGILYTTGPWNIIYALNGKTGAELWHYDPKVPPEKLRYACCGVSNRGVALWQDKVFEGTLDGRLLALDRDSGKLLWEVQTGENGLPYAISGAPRVVNGKVIIGNGGAEYGVRGYVTAYDAATGGQVWRFYIVPGDPARGFESRAMEMAAKTWSGEWWKYGGGGNAWDSFAYDPELNLLYIGAGNGGPYPGDMRSSGGGDNLFLSSIVAVNADTGEYVWHFQTTPGDSWDYTATQQMILTELEINGVRRKVIMQAPKNGFFYVLDRKTGEFISARNLVPVNWTTGLDPVSGRPAIPTVSFYREHPITLRPGVVGAHNWHSMAFSPVTSLVYIPAMETMYTYSRTPDPHPTFSRGSWNLWERTDSPAATDDFPVRGHLVAWDPVSQREVWRVQYDYAWNGGVLATAGNLLFQGTADGRFLAYQADDGSLLWEIPVQTGIIAAPVTYMADGEQYIAINAGWGGTWSLVGGQRPALDRPMATDRLLVFKLGAVGQLPDAPVPAAPMPEPPPLTATADTVKQGGMLYHKTCYVCHGVAAISGGNVADLRYLTPDKHKQFNEIVLDGIYSDLGMAGFADILTQADAEALHAYIISRAREDYQVQAQQ